MALLFQRPTGSPMQFYLAELPEEILKQYTKQIEKNGGKVEKVPQKNVLTFTFPAYSYQFRYVFDIKFIDDCLKHRKILNVNEYYIGDSRISPACVMSKMAVRDGTCLYYIIGAQNLEPELINKAQSDPPKNIVCDFSKSSKPKRTNSRSKISSSVSDSSDLECESYSSKFRRLASKPRTVNDLSESNGSKTTDKISDSFDSEPDASHSKTEESPSEFECSDVDYESDENPKPSTSKTGSNKSGRKDWSKDTNLSEELIQWAKEVSQERSKDEFGYPKDYGYAYRPWERKMIVNFLVKAKLIYKAKALSTWRLAHNLKILPKRRTFDSVYTEFSKSILPSIESYNLPSEIEEQFINLRTFGRSAFKIPTTELKKWAEDITKNRRKDKFGYPREEGILFQTWERETMVKFLIKTGQIRRAKSVNIWKLACSLKILPKRRTCLSCLKQFRTKILPNIECFKLPKEIEAQFLRLRTTPG